MKGVEKYIRQNIMALSPYSTARDECKEKMEVYLDANENPFDNGVNRYPSPYQQELKSAIAKINGCEVSNLFLGNGSDEAIDLIFRIFCQPRESNAIIISPSYGMYSVAAKINDVEIIEYRLEKEFRLNADSLLSKATPQSRVIFLCSPNNPTGNTLAPEEIKKVIERFEGIVVIDEAYIEFADTPSSLPLIKEYDNLIILRTLSKAYGMAGLRVGIAMANPYIIGYMNRVKYPYNISRVAQDKALELLGKSFEIEQMIRVIKSERKFLYDSLANLPIVSKVYDSEANFLLVKFIDKDTVFNTLYKNGIITRDRSSAYGCEGCLRISVGTPQENEKLITLLYKMAGLSIPLDFERNRESKNSGRSAIVTRKSSETAIQVAVNLDKFAPPVVDTGLKFFDHMLEQIGFHGNISLRIECKGDLERDDHHTVEDVAITLAEAIRKALGEKKGIERYGFVLPMDESRAMVLIDLGGRIAFEWDVTFHTEKVGDVTTQMFNHFFKSMAQALGANIHIKATGENDHHIAEAIFKAFARALKCAVKQQEQCNIIPSSKGFL